MASGQRWEYLVIGEPGRLPELGREGWELVAVVPEGGASTLYLKRPVPSVREQITLEQRTQALAAGAADAPGTRAGGEAQE